MFFAFKDENDRRRAPWRYDSGEEESFDAYEEEEEEMDEPEGEEDRKAPIALRVLVWAAVVIVFFAVGYWGSGFALKWLDSKGVIKDEQVVHTADEARQIASTGEESETAHGPRSRFRIFVPSEGSFREESVSFVAGLLEDDLKNVLAGLFETYRDEELLSGDVRVLHVFRNGDRVYLDLNDPFLESVSGMSEEKAVSVITGIVSTVSTNFSPVTRVRFLVNGKEVNESKPVDLSSYWAMPS